MTLSPLALMPMLLVVAGQVAYAAHAGDDPPVVGYAATWLIMRVVGKPDGYPRSHIAVYDERDVTYEPFVASFKNGSSESPPMYGFTVMPVACGPRLWEHSPGFVSRRAVLARELHGQGAD